MLESPALTTAEKCSGYRYIVYRFPTCANLNSTEQTTLGLLLKQDLNELERESVISTQRVVHRRDKKRIAEFETANELLTLANTHPQGQ